MNIPFTDLRAQLLETEAEWRAALDRFMERGRFILGEEVLAFEREFAQETGAAHAVGVSSGTAALELCLRAAGLAGTGAEVLTSPLTAPFTGLAILAAGCRPRFADIDPRTLLLSPADAADRASKKTAALIPVHLYGQSCDMPAFATLARRLHATLIQDACQAHGARCGKRPFTAFSPYVAYSFYPTKNLGCLGDGGAVATGNRSVAARVRLLRDGARDQRHVSAEPAMNARLDEIQASFLRVFLPRLAARNERRRQLAAIYHDELQGIPGIQPVLQQNGSVYHLYVVRAKRREHLRRFLEKQGVGTAVHYPVPLHLHPAFRCCGVKRGDLPHAEKACREILSLPLWPGMPDDAAREVARLIRVFASSGFENRVF